MRKKRLSLVIVVVVVLAIAGISIKLFLDSIYRMPILMYHSINYTADKSDRMTISPDVFERQMKYLRDHKYNVIPISEAVSYIKDRKAPPKKTVAITLDDGYGDNYKYAYPILKKYNIPAAIFVIAEFGDKKGFLTWDEIKEMSESGIDIESHAMSHLMLTYVDDSVLKHQLEDSKRMLEEKIRKPVDYLCYPLGRYDERVKKATREAGYKAAFATKPKRTSPDYDIYEIKRVRISPTANKMFVFAIKLSGYHAFFKVMQDDYKDVSRLSWKKRRS